MGFAVAVAAIIEAKSIVFKGLTMYQHINMYWERSSRIEGLFDITLKIILRLRAQGQSIRIVSLEDEQNRVRRKGQREQFETI